MKNIFFAIFLATLVTSPHILNAQEAGSESLPTTSESSAVETNNSEESESGIKLELTVDEEKELTTDEKFELARKAIKQSLGEEFASELKHGIDELSDDEKERLVSALEDGVVFNMEGDGIPLSVLFLAVPAVVLTLGMPVIIVLLVLWFGHKKRRQRVELINKFLDAGKDVPQEVLHTIDNGGGDSLKRGIMLTGIGLGIVAGFSAVEESTIAGLGLIPMFIGIARLAYWYLAERKQRV